MRAGRLFMAHDGLSPAKGFRFDFLSEEGSQVFMGEQAALEREGLSWSTHLESADPPHQEWGKNKDSAWQGGDFSSSGSGSVQSRGLSAGISVWLAPLDFHQPHLSKVKALQG